MSTQEKKNQKEKPNLPINKYSVHELKSTCDSKIIEFLEDKKFTEVHTNENLKIGIGLFSLVWTFLAYFNGRQFPDNYYIIISCLVLYSIGSVMYWYVDKKIIQNVFYTGYNNDYFKRVTTKQVKEIKLSSEMQEYSQYYTLLIEVVLNNGKSTTEKFSKSCCELIDVRGYTEVSKVQSFFEKSLENVLKA